MAYHKYHAKKTAVGGVTFDSQKEAERYMELKLLEKAGEISELKLQPRFTLLNNFKHDGETIRKVEYVADFQYVDMKTGATVVEDVKGYRTDVYKLKRKFFLEKYGKLVDFREI